MFEILQILMVVLIFAIIRDYFRLPLIPPINQHQMSALNLGYIQVLKFRHLQCYVLLKIRSIFPI